MVFREEAYPPVVHHLGTVPHLGHKVPLLITPTRTCRGAESIVTHVDELLPEIRRLYPVSGKRAGLIKRFVTMLERELGPVSERWGYRHLWANDDRARARYGSGRLLPERIALCAASSLAKPLIKHWSPHDEHALMGTLGLINWVFAHVGDALAGGEQFLYGARLSTADVTFATLSAPILLPENYGPSPAVTLAELPAIVAREVVRLRSTAAGVYALRLYRENRNSPPMSTTGQTNHEADRAVRGDRFVSGDS